MSENKGEVVKCLVSSRHFLVQINNVNNVLVPCCTWKYIPTTYSGAVIIPESLGVINYDRVLNEGNKNCFKDVVPSTHSLSF